MCKVTEKLVTQVFCTFTSVNFLAHFYLSGNNSDLLVGNYIADAVKGSRFNNYPPGIRKGILMHRHIDHYTDTHEIVRLSTHRLRADFRHYAPVIVDVFYDHFLAVKWNTYNNLDLRDFAIDVYEKLEAAKEFLPDKPAQMLPYMKKYDWLSSYAYIEGIHQVLNGMSRRTPYVSGMERASFALKEHYSAFEQEFDLFFPKLELSCTEFLREYQEP